MRKTKIVSLLAICTLLSTYPNCKIATATSDELPQIATEEEVVITTTDTYEEAPKEEAAVFEGYKSVPLSEEVQSQINDICVKYEIPFELMLGIAMQESSFDTEAYNDKSGDYGLFQINAKTWNDTAVEIGHSDYKTDVIENAEMACYIFRYCLKRANGSVREALNYYRTGTPSNKYEAESDYATIVLENYKNIKESE